MKFISIKYSCKKLRVFRCANHSDEPFNTKIVISKGFHDFLSLISIAQKVKRLSVFTQFRHSLTGKTAFFYGITKKFMPYRNSFFPMTEKNFAKQNSPQAAQKNAAA